jgi:transposase
MLMAYDVRSGMPLLSRMYKGGAADGVSVRELFRQAHLAGMLFLADKGFLSEENRALFTSDSQPVRDRAFQE